MTIWDLPVLLDYICKSKPLCQLSMTELLQRVFALIMIFATARIIEVWRMDVWHIIKSDGDRQWTIPTHRKTDRGTRTSMLTLMRLPDAHICPVRYLEELISRLGPPSSSSFSSSSSSSSTSTRFVWDNGTPVSSVASIYPLLNRLLREAKIPEKYTANSIRHAAITKLINTVHDVSKVNIFTGHSQRANTAPKFYSHLVGEWLGFALADAPPVLTPIVPRIDVDGEPKQEKSKSDNEQNSDVDEDNTD
jgi:hypothetical protein